MSKGKALPRVLKTLPKGKVSPRIIRLLEALDAHGSVAVKWDDHWGFCRGSVSKHGQDFEVSYTETSYDCLTPSAEETKSRVYTANAIVGFLLSTEDAEEGY